MSWTIKPISSLAQCAEDWQSLNRRASQSPLLDFLFVQDLLAEFTRGDEVIAILREKGTAQAIAIMQRANRFSWQTLQPANAPIGLWISDPALDLEAALRRLARALSPQCALVSLTQQDPDILPRPHVSSHLSTLDYITTGRVRFPETFAEYFQGRSKNFRHNISRQKNRLKRDNITARLEIVTAASGMAEAVSDYSRLECASWKAEIDSAVRMDDPQGRFYVKMMTDFAARDDGLVYRYFFNDRLVASDLCIRRGDMLIILKTACDETIQGLSTAHLMRIDAFAELVDKHHVRCVEFYGPFKEWHSRLTDEARQMYHVNCYRWRLFKHLHERRMTRPQADGDHDNKAGHDAPPAQATTEPLEMAREGQEG